MSEKRLDAKNRWRNVVVAFRMSPEEACNFVICYYGNRSSMWSIINTSCI